MSKSYKAYTVSNIGSVTEDRLLPWFHLAAVTDGGDRHLVRCWLVYHLFNVDREEHFFSFFIIRGWPSFTTFLHDHTSSCLL